MRKCLEDKQREAFANPFLERMSACIVPHVPEQFGYEVPERLRARTRFVGPIVRLPDAVAQQALRGKYGIAPDDFLLTSTVGGGGFEAQADAFFAVVIDAHRRLHGAVPGLQIAHAGRKASAQRPWYGSGPLGAEDAERGDLPWQVVAPSSVAVADGWQEPHGRWFRQTKFPPSSSKSSGR